MSRRNKKTSLFEVFGGGMDAPEWMKKGSARAEPVRPAHVQLRRPPEIDRPAPSAGQPDEGSGLVESRSAEPRGENAGQRDSGGGVRPIRLVVSVSPLGAAATALVLLLLLLGVYKLGQASRTGSPGGEGMDMTAPQPREGYDYQAVQAKAVAELPDDDLLIIARDVANVDEARAIQEYLWRAGFTVVVNAETDLISIIDTVRVATMTPEQLSTYREELARLGDSPDWKLRNKYDFSRTEIFKR